MLCTKIYIKYPKYKKILEHLKGSGIPIIFPCSNSLDSHFTNILEHHTCNTNENFQLNQISKPSMLRKF
jgi:hypothetical protein